MKIFILSIVQGITEFLPVSSSGHLSILENIFSVKNQLTVCVFLHFGTLLALICFLYKEIFYILASPFRRDKDNLKLLGLLFIGSIPAGVSGFLFKNSIEQIFKTPVYTGFAFLVTGLILFFTRFKQKNERGIEPNREGLINQAPTISFLSAFFIGIGQAIALIPGISRSGTTIAFGMYANIDGETATRFSFLLAIPAILGASLYELRNIQKIELRVSGIIIGILGAAISGYFALRVILKIVRKGKFAYFSYYLFLLGIITIFFYFKT